MPVTVLLTAACLVKSVVVPALALWVWWIARSERARRGPILAAHLAVILGVALASASPFLEGWHTLAPFATLGGLEAWASPSHLVGGAAHAIAGSDAARGVEAAFLLVFVVLLWRLARRSGAAAAPADAWGVALLLLALSLPFLLPWYAAWFAPFLGLLEDGVLVLAGALVSGVLALTLIPADPFHGRTSPAVFDLVHYGAASVLLGVLVVVAFRVLGGAGGCGGRAAAGSPAGAGQGA